MADCVLENVGSRGVRDILSAGTAEADTSVQIQNYREKIALDRGDMKVTELGVRGETC